MPITLVLDLGCECVHVGEVGMSAAADHDPQSSQLAVLPEPTTHQIRKSPAALSPFGSKTVHPDVLLAPHPEMYDMPGKRAKIADGSPNPFVKVGEFNAFVDDLEKQFVAGLEKETAEAQAKK